MAHLLELLWLRYQCKERTPVRTTFSLFWANAQGLRPSFELTTNLEEPVPSLVAAQARNTPDHLMRMHAFPDNIYIYTVHTAIIWHLENTIFVQGLGSGI